MTTLFNKLKENKNFKGLWIPKEIYLLDELNWNEKIILSEIKRFYDYDKEGVCGTLTFISEYFAKLLNTTGRTVFTSINKFEEYGFVKFEKRTKKFTSNISMKKFHTNCFATIIISKKYNVIKTIKPYSTNKSKIKTFRINRWTTKILDQWNEYEHTRKHTKLNTKIRWDVSLYLRQLKGGFFDDNDINETFIKRNKIPKRMTSKKYSEEELKEGIKRLGLLLNPDYWPANKKGFGKGLSSLIYNPMTGSSMFLFVMNRKPRRITGESKHQRIEKLFFDKLDINVNNRYHKFNDGVENIIKFHKRININIDPIIEARFKTPYLLCKQYIYFIETQKWIKDFDINIVDANSMIFKKFIKSLNEEYYGMRIVK